MARCPGCGNECRRYWTAFGDGFTWQRVVGFIVWAAFWIAVFGDLPFLFGLLFVFPVCWAYKEAETRLYHAWWAWWHPERCGGGGHAEPEPEPT